MKQCIVFTSRLEISGETKSKNMCDVLMKCNCIWHSWMHFYAELEQNEGVPKSMFKYIKILSTKY